MAGPKDLGVNGCCKVDHVKARSDGFLEYNPRDQDLVVEETDETVPVAELLQRDQRARVTRDAALAGQALSSVSRFS